VTRLLRGLWILLGIIVCGAGTLAVAEGTVDFAARRAQVLALLDTGSAMVLRSPDMPMRNADGNYRFRQESNLLYLSGLNRPQVVLMLVPSGIALGDTMARVLVFAHEATDGDEPLPGFPDGIVLAPARFQEILASLLSRATKLYVNQPGIGFTYDWLNGKPLWFERDSRKEAEQKYPQLKVKNAGPLLGGLRQRKSAAEVDLIRKAIRATDEGIRRAMQFCRPGVHEYELQAEIEYAATRSGAWGQSFPSIVGSGPNALILHYELNRRVARTGEVVVMDVGAEMNGYAADVTRTIPVSGKFSASQRKVYDVVLRAERAVIAAIHPGVSWKALDAVARAVIKEAGYDRFWSHSVSHHLGLDVHDAGVMDTLREGMVITVEPGVYIPGADTTVSAEYRGIGVRIEDDVLVTSAGAEVLSSQVPKDAADIERIMRRKR
jgi:Xaa-Pro aminopeptidase